MTFIPPLSLRLRCRCPIPNRGRLKPKRAVAPNGPLFLWADTEGTRLNGHYRSVPCMRSTKSRLLHPMAFLDDSVQNPPRNSMRYVTRPAFLCVEYNYTQRTLELTVDNPLDNGLLVCFILGHLWPNVTVLPDRPALGKPRVLYRARCCSTSKAFLKYARYAAIWIGYSQPNLHPGTILRGLRFGIRPWPSNKNIPHIKNVDLVPSPRRMAARPALIHTSHLS